MSDSDASPNDDEYEDGGEYQVTAVIGYRTSLESGEEFLILWSNGETSWEPRHNLGPGLITNINYLFGIIRTMRYEKRIDETGRWVNEDDSGGRF